MGFLSRLLGGKQEVASIVVKKDNDAVDEELTQILEKTAGTSNVVIPHNGRIDVVPRRVLSDQPQSMIETKGVVEARTSALNNAHKAGLS